MRDRYSAFTELTKGSLLREGFPKVSFGTWVEPSGVFLEMG
jgi:hypothetical protein